MQRVLHAALTSLVGNNQGEDLQALEEFWGRFVHGDQAIFPALDHAMHALVQGAIDYGAMVHDFTDQLRQAIVQAALEAGAEALVAILIDVATDGVGLVLGGAEGEAIAARAVEHVGEVCANLLAALQVASTIQDIGVYGTTNLAEAMTKVPQPNLTTQEAWQAGDDVSPRGQFDQGGDKGETAIASYLQERGHVVMPINEDHSKEDRNADALVDGQPVDFKKMIGSGSRTLRTALKGSERGGGQTDEIFVDARSSSLGPEQLKAQLQAYFSGQGQPGSAGIIKRVTVLANDGSRVTYPDGYGGL